MKTWLIIVHSLAALGMSTLGFFAYHHFVDPPEIQYLPAPADPGPPQSGPPDTVWVEREYLESLLARQYPGGDARTPGIVHQAVQDEPAAARDTSTSPPSIGLRLTTSRKVFTFNSMLGPNVVTVDAKAPCAVTNFMAQSEYPKQEQYVGMMHNKWKKENPPPPDRFMSGFGWGAATTLIAEVAIFVTVAIIVK